MMTDHAQTTSAQDRQRRTGYGKAIGGAVGAVIGATLDRAVASVGSLGRAVGSGLRLSGLTAGYGQSHHYPELGGGAGIENAPNVQIAPPPETVHIRCIDYGPDHHTVSEIPLDDLNELLAQPKPENASVRWINVDGLHPYVINAFREAYGYHTLSAEDVLHAPQRPKVERHDTYLFVIARMPRVAEGRLSAEQLSMFLSPGLVVTFQETRGDAFDPIRKRLGDPESLVRNDGADHLVYALLDAMVDHCFPILESFGDLLEDLEEQVLEQSTPELLRRIHGIKRELSLLRRMIWPMRELVGVLQGQDHRMIDPNLKPYLRDVYDHTVQIVDIIETFRDMVAGLTDLYMSVQGNRMNEIMKVLTIMATLFIPITFVAGVYGMNFKHMPELQWRYSYLGFWGVCILITVGLLGYFRWRGWIGK